MTVDIRIKTSFATHRKRKKLQAHLGTAGVVCLIDLWLSAADNNPTGRLDAMTAEDIELAAGWPGEPGRFVAELVELKWLNLDAEGAYILHDWEDHQAWLVKAPDRVAAAKAAIAARWERRTAKVADTPRIRPVIRKAEKRNTPLPSSPSPSSPIPTIQTVPEGGEQQEAKEQPAGKVEPQEFQLTADPPDKKQTGWGTWTDAQFHDAVKCANHDAMLTPTEAKDFCDYWLELSRSGIPRFKLEKTWDTRRRMATSLRICYEPQRARDARGMQQGSQRLALGQVLHTDAVTAAGPRMNTEKV